MKPRFGGLTLAALAGILFALSGCQTVAETVEETVSFPVRAAGAGVKGIVKGVGQLERVGRNVVGRLATDRDRGALLREHRETKAHYAKVNAYIGRRGIRLDKNERRILRNAKDSLATVGRQLEAKRIPGPQGMQIQRLLEEVRSTFGLFYKQHNTPPYRGFTAVR